MQVWRSIGLSMVVLALGLAPAAGAEGPIREVGANLASSGEGFAAPEAIVRYERGATAQTRRLARRGAGVEFDRVVELARTELVAVDGSLAAAVRRLERQPGVEFAQPNYRYRALAPAPNDSFFGELWGLTGTHGVRALPAWDSSTGGGVTIAVLDTGVDLTHPDLAPRLWSNPGQGVSGDGDGNGFDGDVHGYDFIDGDGDPDDFHFHGTHVAGTAAAAAGNALGVAGVAPGAQIMAVRVLDGNGEGSTATIAAGIKYAAEEGARVLNLSLGGPANAEDHLVSAAIDIANARRALVVAAAGNEGTDNDVVRTTPCAMPQPNVICVAAIDQAGNLAKFSSTGASNFGSKSVDVAAPGTTILSAKPAYGPTLFAEDFEGGAASTWPRGEYNGGVEWGEVVSAGGNKLITDSPGVPFALYAPAGGLASHSESHIVSSSFDLGDQRGCRLFFKGKYEIEGPKNGLLTDAFLAGGARVEESNLVDADGNLFVGRSSGYVRKEIEEGKYRTGLSSLEGSLAHVSDRDDARVWFAVLANAQNQFDGAYVDDVHVSCRGQGYHDDVFEGFVGWEAPTSGSYFRLQGTSMAAPHVAGVAALVLGTLPGLTAAEAVEAIKQGARPLASLAGKTVTGGAVDAPGAIAAALRPPSVSIDQAPAPLIRQRRPAISFSADRPANFACSLDGGGFAPCSSPFVPVAPLTEGFHGFVVRATDSAGRSGQSTVVGFRIDARPPRVILRKRPRKVVRTRTRRARAVFRIASNERGVRFICRVNGGPARFCGARFARRYGVGRNAVRIRAVDPAGNITRRATVYRFRVKRIR